MRGQKWYSDPVHVLQAHDLGAPWSWTEEEAAQRESSWSRPALQPPSWQPDGPAKASRDGPELQALAEVSGSGSDRYR